MFADTYVRPLLGARKMRDVMLEVILTWQRRLLKEGSGPGRQGRAPNTIRLARAPLAGAFTLAMTMAWSRSTRSCGPRSQEGRRSTPKHWSPEDGRRFVALMEGDRTYAVWAFLMGSGLRIGELVALRRPNVDLDARVVRVVEFSTYVGHDVVASSGKSRDAVRSVDLDNGLVAVLRAQRRQQAAEALAAASHEASEHVFTKPSGGPYHPQYLSRLLEVTAEAGPPRLTAHGLRHTCVPARGGFSGSIVGGEQRGLLAPPVTWLGGASWMPATTRSATSEAHQKAVVFEVKDIARYLQETLGQKLVAYMAGVVDPKRVGRWAQGQQAPRADAERRLRAAFQIFHLLIAQDSAHVVRAWFIGMNPQLGDDSPAEAIHDGRLKETLAAAKAFVSGG